MTDDHFSDFDEDRSSAPVTKSTSNFAQEKFSKKIFARSRTFFIDVKESGHGSYLKISEKSKGKKSTIIMDAEDVEEFVAALEEAKNKL